MTSTLTLISIPLGEIYIIQRLEGDPVLCRKLREVGLSEGMPISKISQGKNILCLIAGTRMALNESLAACIILGKESQP